MEKDLSKNLTFFRFEDLRVYHKALDYIDWVLNATKTFPEDTKIVGDRFLTSAHLIAFNIAEGSSRNKNQFIYYLKMAKSAIRECIVFTSLAEKQMTFTDKQIDESRNELMELTKMIGALIGSLQKASRDKRDYHEKDLTDDFEREFDDDLLPEETYPNRKY
jgi:four helix bundle protein